MTIFPPTKGNIKLGYLSGELESVYGELKEENLSEDDYDKVVKNILNELKEVLKTEPNCLNEKVYYAHDVEGLAPPGEARFGGYLLHSFVRCEVNVEYFKEILHNNPQIDINLVHNDHTLIRLAILMNNQPVFDYLIEQSHINLNIVDKNGNSLLHQINTQLWPILPSYLNMIKKIVANPRSDCFIKNKQGQTAYDNYLPEYQKYFNECVAEKEKVLFEQQIKTTTKTTKIKV